MEAAWSYCIMFLQQILDGILTVWIWGTLPILSLVYAAIGGVVMWLKGDIGVAKAVREFRRESKGAYLSRVLHQITRSSAIATIFLFLCPLFLYLNLRYDSLVLSLVDNTGTLCSIVIGLTTIVLTVSVVIVIFSKNYYLVFSISDVLKTYHFTACLGGILSSCLGTCVCCLLITAMEADTLWGKAVLLVLEWCVLCNLIAAAVSFWIIYEVMFSNRKVELRLLDRLYLIFRGGSLPDEADAKPAGEWDWPAVRTNVEYLCAGYITTARKLPIHRVRRLGYLVGDEREKSFDEWYLKLKLLYAAVTVGLCLVSLTVTLTLLELDGLGLAIVDVGVCLLCLFPFLFFNDKVKSGMHELFSESLGYTMDMEPGRRIHILRYSIGPVRKYDKFIRRMNSLTGFFYVAMQRGVRTELIEQALGVVMDWFDDVREHHDSFYLPVFAIGYFAFEQGIRFPEVKQYYDAMWEEPAPALVDKQAEAEAAGQGMDLYAAMTGSAGRDEAESAADGCGEEVSAQRKSGPAAAAEQHRRDFTAFLDHFRKGGPGGAVLPEREQSLEDYFIGFYREVETLVPGSMDWVKKLISPRVMKSGHDEFDAMLAGHLLDLTQDRAAGNPDIVRSVVEYINWLHGIDRTVM